MIRSSYLVTIVMLCLFSSCKHDVDEKGLTEYIARTDHGLTKEKSAGDVNVRVVYKPQDMCIKQQLRNVVKLTTDTITKLKELFNKQLYFKVSLSINNRELLNSLAGSQAEYAKIVNRLAFGMSEKVFLVSSERDTLEMMDYAFPRTFGVSNSTDLLFAFRNRNLNKASWIELKMLDIGLGMQNMSFRFYVKDIEKIPHLIIK